MEEEGVELMLGSDVSLGIEKVDYAYISPTVPENSPIRKLLNDKKLKYLTMITFQKLLTIYWI